jgi:FlaG/FlaF family flagellin (archaellin)
MFERLQKAKEALASDNRGLSEATTVVLLIVVGVAAAGAVSGAIGGYTSGIAPTPGADVTVDQQDNTLSITVNSVDDGLDKIEVGGDNSGAEFDNGSNETTGVQVGDVYTYGNASDSGDAGLTTGDTITIIAVGEEGGEKTIETVEVA